MKFPIFFVFNLLVALPLTAETTPVDMAPQETIITSDLFEMVGGETENYFHFNGSVIVTGTNLRATCDEMEVVADREQSEAEEKVVGKVGTIQSIIMKGNVVIEQSGRRAEAGHAEILPRDDKVVLSEHPKVIDNEGTVSGWRITLYKGERKALVEGKPGTDGKPGERPRIQLPAFQDLGFEDKASTDSTTGGSVNQGGRP